MKSVLLSLPFFSSLCSLHSGSLPFYPGSGLVQRFHHTLICNVLMTLKTSWFNLSIQVYCLCPKICQFLSEFQGLCFLNVLSKYYLMPLFISLVPTATSPFSSNLIKLGHIFLLVGLAKGWIPFLFQRTQILFHWFFVIFPFIFLSSISSLSLLTSLYGIWVWLALVF